MDSENLNSNLVNEDSESIFRDSNILSNEEGNASDGNKVLATIELQSVQKDLLNETSLDSNIGDDYLNIDENNPNLFDEKPTETYKKVKLKRSHILKDLSMTSTSLAPLNAATISSIDNEKSKALNIDIPDDITSTSVDLDTNDLSSNSDTCSPTPRKKVKLIRNSPRFQTTSSVSYNQSSTVNDKDQISIKMQADEIQQKSIYNIDQSNDISDVMAQIDQLIGSDGENDVIATISEVEKITDSNEMTLIEELETEIDTIPPSEIKDIQSIEEGLLRTVEAVSKSIIDNENEQPMMDENFSLILDDSSDGANTNASNSISVAKIVDTIPQQNIAIDVNIEESISKNIETVEDLEQKLLQVSTEIESVNQARGTPEDLDKDVSINLKNDVDNLLVSPTEEMELKDEQIIHNSGEGIKETYETVEQNIEAYSIEKDELIKEKINEIEQNDSNILNFEKESTKEIEKLSENVTEEPEQLKNDEVNQKSEENLSETFEDSLCTVEETESSLKQKLNTEIISTVKENEIELPEPEEKIKAPKITLTIKRSEIRSPKLEEINEEKQLKSTLSDTSSGIPKITIKPIKKVVENELLDTASVPKLVISTVEKTDTDTIPKITIKTVKKQLDTFENDASKTELQVVKVSSSDNNATSEIVDSTIPKLTIKSLKKVDQKDSSEINIIPKITIKTKKIDSTTAETVTQSSLPTEMIIPKFTIKASKKMSDETVTSSENENVPKLTIKGIKKQITPDSTECTDISPATKSSLAAANVELIPTSSFKDEKTRKSDNFYDEDGIEVIPSSSNVEYVPKLSIRALKQSLQNESDLSSISIEQDNKTIPCSNSSKLIIKPVLNMENLVYKGKPILSQRPGPKSKKIEMMEKMAARLAAREQSVLTDDNKADRILIKINKNNETQSKSHLITPDSYLPTDPLEKITLKLSKEGGHPEILHSPKSGVSSSLKRMISSETTIEPVSVEIKRNKTVDIDYICNSPDVSIDLVHTDLNKSKHLSTISDDVTIVRVPNEKNLSESSKLKDVLLNAIPVRIDSPDIDSNSSDDVKIVEIITPSVDPLSISNDESSSQDVMIVNEMPAPTPPPPPQQVEEVQPTPIVRKRGRPRKLPLEVREELKEEDEEMVVQETVSDEENDIRLPTPPTRGKRGGYRPRRGRGRGRGNRGGYRRRLEDKKSLLATITSDVTVALDKIDLDKKISLKTLKGNKTADAVFLEEDTRMSADGEMIDNTHHHPLMKPEVTDESRSSSTTENNRNKRGRLEITEMDQMRHVTGPEQIAEYTWANCGPYMLQEQIAQYLGVKSFKRKYPGLTRHAVDMQERDYIRENGLASEALCDMGLTAVLSSEILDIMFTDFQDKYEEYRKYQREKQAKDVTNKQRAMATSIADSDCREESLLSKAIKSAASWNITLNKTRREERECAVDLQSFNIMYPRGHKPVRLNTNPGHYPVALVPGQFSEYYKAYTSTEMKYFPLNTVLYGPPVTNRVSNLPDISDGGSCSESESSSGSDSDSSDDSDSTTMDGISTPITSNSNIFANNTENETCKICITCSPKSRPIKSQLIYCAQCNAGIHPRCIDLTPEMMPFIQAYPWQCTDCKTCWHCRAPSDDDKMLFCDRCDRGYHIYCVGLRKVPNGRWHCQQCVNGTTMATFNSINA